MFKNIKKSIQTRNRLCSLERAPFFELAEKYLPDDPTAVIVDIGSGEGLFADNLGLAKKFKNLFLLDANQTVVDTLKGRFNNALLYRAPDYLSFEDGSVNFIHCSHLIEHLTPQDLYKFLKEMDRVLAVSGILCVSSPMLWQEFYSDMEHIKPYHYKTFQIYLCGKGPGRTENVVSENYSMIDLHYRYYSRNLYENLGSDILTVEILMRLIKKLSKKLHLKKYEKNGFTVVLKKAA